MNLSKKNADAMISFLKLNNSAAPVAGVQSKVVKNKKKKASRKRGAGADAQISAPPTARFTQHRTGNPVMRSSGSSDARVTISHSEYVMDINGSIANDLSGLICLSVNPGNTQTFPWLANIARNYETYLFRKLVFHYQTVKNTSAYGTVVLTFDFDAADTPPVTKTGLLQMHGAVRSVLWADVDCVASPQDLSKFGIQRFVRVHSNPVGTDIKTYDVANLLICPTNCSDAMMCGELRVSYVVDLMTPQSNTEKFVDPSGKITSGGGNISRTSPFGDGPTVVTGDEHAVGVYSGGQLLFNDIGEYILDVIAYGTGFAAGPIPAMAVTYGAATFAIIDSLTNGAATCGTSYIRIKPTVPGTRVSFDWTNTATTLTGLITRIAPYLYTLA
jgi:hypothetical protein